MAVRIRLFHDRGGSVGARRRPKLRRDPRPARRARWQGQICITEQGEIISSKYSNGEVGRRNLETLLAATLEATLLEEQVAAPDLSFLDATEALSTSAYKAYRGLVYETPRASRNIFGLRPSSPRSRRLTLARARASRKKTTAIEDLRARSPGPSPWAQAGRGMLPGWFGFGTAVKEFIAAHPKDVKTQQLRTMYRRWPFFRTQLSNMDMVLAKSSLAIASRYAALVPDVALREAIFSRISREVWHEAVDALNAIMEQSEFLQSNPLLLGLRSAIASPTSIRSTMCRSSCSSSIAAMRRATRCFRGSS